VHHGPSRPRISPAWLFGSALLLGGAHYYYPFLADDTLISLRYADRLLHGRGLTWDDYHPVEGFSNLLWTLSAAAVGGLGLDLVSASRVLCLASALGCCALFAAFARLRSGDRAHDSLAAWLACGFFGSSPDVQAWSVGGLEQTQLALLLLAAYATHLLYHERGDARWLRVSAALHVLLVFTRPDSALFCAVSLLAASWLAVDRPQRRAAWVWLGGASTCAVLVKHGFSHAYYGEWVPNTAYIKLAFTRTRLLGGYDYWSTYLQGIIPLLCAALLLGVSRQAGAQPRVGRELGYLASGFAVWSAYVVFIGGDIFPAQRHGLVLTALACFALVIPARARGARQERPWLLGLSALVLVTYGMGRQLHGSSQRARLERWEFPCALFAERLGQAFVREQPSIAVQAAGCMGYYSRLPALDLYGLNDWTIARHPPADLGEKRIGHEFGGNAAAAEYVWARNPTFIIAHTGARAEFPFAPEVARRLLARYRPVAFTQPGRQSWAMLSRDSALVAPVADGTALRFLPIAIEPVAPGAIAPLRLDEREALYELSQPSRLSSRAVPAGSYKLEIELARGAAVEVRCNDASTPEIHVGASGLECRLEAIGGTPAWIRGVRLTPLDVQSAEPRREAGARGHAG
jgi:hypothetical protein